MAKTAGDKISNGLAQLLAGFAELEEMLEEDYGSDPEDEELAAAIVSELTAAIDTVIDGEDYTPAFIAQVISTLGDALEEMDPSIFEDSEEEEESEELDEEDLIDDDFDYEDDDDFYN
ncbi:MAG: hypothetical protein H6619_04900 [Deltaproteobacteria bacterium]|nr:hypothetical protein [Deltaproteobacteria bacterium]